MRIPIRPEGAPQRFLLLPLAAHAAARVIRRHFTPEQIQELVRLLHWGAEEKR